jgi:predicted GIY-YIG superfamily endonuclease
MIIKVRDSELEKVYPIHRHDNRPWDYYIYVILTQDGKYYAGQTGNLQNRIFTHMYRPEGYFIGHPYQQLVYLKNVDSRLEAIYFEAALWHMIIRGEFQPQKDLNRCETLEKRIRYKINNLKGDA